jgi:hypothetical protein
MFSNDNNVETIAQLVEAVKRYVGLQSEYIRLDVIEKTVRLLTAIAIISVFVLLLIIAMIYFSFAAAFALETLTGRVGAFCIVGAFYLLLFILFVIYRKRLVEKPLVHFLASLLMS